MLTFHYAISLGHKSGAMICGVDEAGLTFLAGPVVECAAILLLAGISTRHPVRLVCAPSRQHLLALCPPRHTC